MPLRSGYGLVIEIPVQGFSIAHSWSGILHDDIGYRAPSNPLIIRVPFILIFGFSKETPKFKGQKGTTQEPKRTHLKATPSEKASKNSSKIALEGRPYMGDC